MRSLFSDTPHYRFPASDQAALTLHALLWLILARAAVDPGSTQRLLPPPDGVSARYPARTALLPALRWILRGLFQSAVILLIAAPVAWLWMARGAANLGSTPAGAGAAIVVLVTAMAWPSLWFAHEGTPPIDPGRPATCLPLLLRLFPVFDQLLRGMAGSLSMLEQIPSLAFALGCPLLFYAGLGLAEASAPDRLLRALWLIAHVEVSRRSRRRTEVSRTQP